MITLLLSVVVNHYKLLILAYTILFVLLVCACVCACVCVCVCVCVCTGGWEGWSIHLPVIAQSG